MKGRGMSIEKRRYLMRVYIREGYTAAAPLAIKYGIKPKTMSKYAKAMGYAGRQGREPGLWNGVTGKKFSDEVKNETNPDSSNHSADQAAVSRAADPSPASIGSL